MILTDGLGNPEGPVLLPDRSWALVEMREDRGCLTHISADGQERRMIARTGRPNGLTIDREGILWVAESMNPPSLLRATLGGEVEVVVTGCDGEPFLFPNDLRFGPDGALYMTDSGILFQEWGKLDDDARRTAKPDGRVYRIDIRTRSVEKLDSGIPFANGIAFGPDNNLYVSATVSGMVYRYRWADGMIRGGQEEFGNVMDPARPEGFGGPDGMAFGRDGDLYVTVSRKGQVAVLGPKGEVVKRIPLHGPSPTNLAFGPVGGKKIYVTEQGIGLFEVHDVGTEGLPLHG